VLSLFLNREMFSGGLHLVKDFEGGTRRSALSFLIAGRRW
jgi:hypothetical protein